MLKKGQAAGSRKIKLSFKLSSNTPKYGHNHTYKGDSSVGWLRWAQELQNIQEAVQATGQDVPSARRKTPETSFINTARVLK